MHIDVPADGASPGGRIVVQGSADRAVYGEGLGALLDLVAERMPRAEVAQVWAFPGVRREGREHGVVVVERHLGENRRLVYRGRWAVHVKGQERGRVVLDLEETAEAVPEMVTRVIEGVRRRADEAGEAELVDLGSWRAGEPAGGR